MDAPRGQGKIPDIEYDDEGLELKLKYRNDFVRPWIIILLLASAFVSVPFGITNAIRAYSQYGGSLVCAILYTVIMGVLVGSFTVLDWAYAWGYIGLPTYEELPNDLYKALRRYSSHSYIRPYVYHDDRVPRNNVGIWKMRLVVPAVYVFSLFVYWSSESAHTAAPLTPSGAQFVFSNILLVSLVILQVKVTISNVYCVRHAWDYVPDMIAPEQTPGSGAGVTRGTK